MGKKNETWMPADLLADILLKLPVKSIIRFKSVAISWFRLFQNPSFISQHLSISKRNKCLLVYYSVSTLEKVVNLMRLFVDETFASHREMNPQLPHRVLNDIFSFMFCVYDGLLCLCDCHSSRLTLWNPATREFKILPECNKNIPPGSCTFSYALGFGLDPLSNDYKVIYIRLYAYEEIRGPNHYSIYNMSTNSWNVLNHEDIQLPKRLGIHCSANNTFVNGVCYWRANSMILAYYFVIEVFQLIQSPCPGTYAKLFPLHDRITIWDTDMINKFEKSYAVWELNDEGRWTKLLNIEPMLGVAITFGFWKNGKILVESITAQLLLYDLEADEFDDSGIKTTSFGSLLQVHFYEESLVAIRRE